MKSPKICRGARPLLMVLLSALLLSLGWLGQSGGFMLGALVPLLVLSEGYSDSRGDWWRMCGWAAMTFLLWSFATIWWVWNAAPIGVIVASIVGSFYNLCGMMAYHYTSKRAPRALAYTLLVSVWLATEWAYNSAEGMTFPWLLLGHGFSNNVMAVQWYEYTGIFGGSLWVLCSNIAIFEALRTRLRSRIVLAAAIIIVPVIVSLSLYCSYDPSERSVQISVVQPNVPCYEEERVAAIAKCGSTAEITRFKGLGEISPDEFEGFIGEQIRLDKVRLTKDDPIMDMLTFYMGKNTYDRQQFIVGNLRIEEDKISE